MRALLLRRGARLEAATMSLLLGIAIIVVADAMAIAALLFVRRRAPEGSYFSDGDRASGVFGVLATGFAIFAGFVIFLAFTTYDDTRSGAEAEALAVVQQFETAQFLPAPIRERVTGELVCYGRYVVHQEWPRDGETGASGTRSTPGRSRCSGACGPRSREAATRAVGVRQVARPDLRSRGGPARPDPRRRRDHPDLDLDRPVPHRRASCSPTCCSSRTAPRWPARRRC